MTFHLPKPIFTVDRETNHKIINDKAKFHSEHDTKIMSTMFKQLGKKGTKVI